MNSFFLAFGRAAGEEELANQVQQIQSGVSLEVLAERLVGSAEYQTRHGTGRKVDTEYLTTLYRDGLGREPGSEELTHWLVEGEKGATRAKESIFAFDERCFYSNNSMTTRELDPLETETLRYLWTPDLNPNAG